MIDNVRLKTISSKHVKERLYLLVSLFFIILVFIPFDFFRLASVIYIAIHLIFLLLGFFIFGWKKTIFKIKSIYLVHLVEIELLRSDFVWNEISSDVATSRRIVELPKVRILESTETMRIVSIRNSVKYQERLLKSDFSSIFNDWIMSEVLLNEDKSEVIVYFYSQKADLNYLFDSLEKLKVFCKAHYSDRIPLDKLNDMKTSGHNLVVGQTGSGKTFALVYLLIFYLANDWSVVIADPKNSDLALLGRSLGLRVATSSDEIIELIVSAYDEMNRRKESLAGKHKFGKTASQQGETNVMIIIDEYASLSLALDKKQLELLNKRVGNIVLEGRQLSMHITLCMQQANAQVVPTQIREQLANKLVLGASDLQTYVTAFGQSQASEIASMLIRPGQGWLLTEGRIKPVFVRMPFLNHDFMTDIDKLVERKREKEQV